MKQQPEYALQCAFVAYCARQYPELIVFSDTAAHIPKTVKQQLRANKLQSCGKWPDLFIAQPSGEYCGLFMEFKAESPFYKKKDGVLKQVERNEGQHDTMLRLRSKGYAALFVWELPQCIAVLNNYLDGKEITQAAKKTEKKEITNNMSAAEFVKATKAGRLKIKKR